MVASVTVVEVCRHTYENDHIQDRKPETREGPVLLFL
jgi:hypothetical protein